VGADPEAARPLAGGALEIPVRFAVVHANTVGSPCVTEGETLTLKGHIVGPQAVLRRADAHVASLYLYGLDGSAAHWRFQAVRGYDHAAEMARLGHTSVTLAMAGLDGIRFRDGHRDCFRAQAEIAHQVIQQLRAGTYEAGSEATRPWRRSRRTRAAGPSTRSPSAP
jgi:hypothetical protein